MRRYLLPLFVLSALFVAFQEFQEYLRVNRLTYSLSEKQVKVDSTLAAVSQVTPIERATASAPSLTALQVAEKYLESHREEWKLQPYHEFRPIEFRTPLGTKIKYSVFQNGIPVLNMEISMQIEKDLTVGKVDNSYMPIAKADLKKKEMPIGEILSLVGNHFVSSEDPKTLTPPVIVVIPGTEIPQVAYLLSVMDKSKKSGPLEILFRASDGQVLGKSRPRSEF